MGVVIVSYVGKFYRNQGNITQALNDMSSATRKQEFTAVMEASSSRKTTPLSVISTIDTVSAGDIGINGDSICELQENELAEFHKKELGFILQNFNLLDILTLQENIVLPLTLLKKRTEQIDPQINALAEILQIQDILERYSYQISGGQRQRCACAGAMIHGPSLILAGEPAGALDSHSSYLLMEQFQRMNTELQAATLMVTHDTFSASHAKRVLFLKDGAIFNEIYRGSLTGKAFFQKILDVMQLLGGDVHAVHQTCASQSETKSEGIQYLCFYSDDYDDTIVYVFRGCLSW